MAYLDIMEQDIYIEYDDKSFQYISFTKAKKLILKELPPVLLFNCADRDKSVSFLNSLLTKYKIFNNTLILK